MLSNARIKQIRSLALKKFRDSSGLFVVEGEKMVAEAVAAGFNILETVRKEDVGEDVMKKISALDTPSPVLAVVEKPRYDAGLPKEGLVLALDGIRDPGNLGTILRIADWFGIEAVYASPDTVDVYNPKTVQATMGAIFRVKTVYTPIPEFCLNARKAGARVFGTFLDGENIYSQNLDSPLSVIVIGNESRGISAETAACVDGRLYIPSYGKSGAESLNAAVATAVTVAEFRRRQ